jgi:hypothetical protein
MHIIAYLAIKAYFTINAYLFAYNPGKRTSGKNIRHFVFGNTNK